QAYRNRDTPFYHSRRASFEATPAEGYAACCAAVPDADFRDELPDDRVPALVFSCVLDRATPPDHHGHLLHDGIPGAHWAILQTGHIANVEQPETYAGVTLDFLRG